VTPARGGPDLTTRRQLIVQGEHAVSTAPDLAMSTILGSCVATCLYDAERGVGGMNHFLLAEAGEGAGAGADAMRYGAYAMEVLINDLMKNGARRDRLQAKLFGGARIIQGFSDVGATNAAFARRFMADEGIAVVAESLGGRRARRVEFWPASGRVRQRAVDEAPPLAPRPPRSLAMADAGGVELF
jgi:chemotaxis protein CheD